ncbi:transglutaminase family protein [Intestinimonas sp.]|uniref:transglutaminase-like domain-containing protein n=1 Tax=Intestinimonas sp. TaxID=1965293 RepID=UPI00263A39AD|nr:transglutaminase-like domain-containing protein [Intestinimonas sp.]
MKKNILKRAGTFVLALALLGTAALTVGAAGWEAKAAKAAVLPQKAEPKTGVTVYANEKASVDASNLAEGYLMVKYTGGKSVRIKVQITKSGGATYTYDLNNTGAVETFPLTEGDGTYTVKVFENTTGTKYAQAFSTSVTMTLRNDFLPFLYPNQYVNYTMDAQTVAVGAQLCTGKTDDLAKVTAVFDWVVDSFTYDYDKAATVQSGYLPVVDTVLAEKKGICFDYAAVMSAMLRSQNIPCKLVVGYAGEIYHAWINVYIEGVGWVDQAIYFDGTNWTLMDPTFTSTGNRSQSIMQYVTDKTNYTQKYAY